MLFSEHSLYELVKKDQPKFLNRKTVEKYGIRHLHLGKTRLIIIVDPTLERNCLDGCDERCH
jgi:hypothetical protein